MAKKPDEHIMKQKDGIEVGYFSSRKDKFNKQLAEGIDRAQSKPVKEKKGRKQ